MNHGSLGTRQRVNNLKFFYYLSLLPFGFAIITALVAFIASPSVAEALASPYFFGTLIWVFFTLATIGFGLWRHWATYMLVEAEQVTVRQLRESTTIRYVDIAEWEIASHSGQRAQDLSVATHDGSELYFDTEAYDCSWVMAQLAFRARAGHWASSVETESEAFQSLLVNPDRTYIFLVRLHSAHYSD